MPTLDDHGAGTVGGVGGPMAQLLEQNYLLLNQYKQNMQQYKVSLAQRAMLSSTWGTLKMPLRPCCLPINNG